MRLGANAVVFVFHGSFSEIGEGFFSVLRWAGQHQAKRMKETHARLVKLMSGGKPQRFPDIAQKHIGSLDLGRFHGQFFTL